MPRTAAAPSCRAFVLVDGIGDVSIPAFGNRTPLQAAAVPHLDAIAGGGCDGCAPALARRKQHSAACCQQDV